MDVNYSPKPIYGSGTQGKAGYRMPILRYETSKSKYLGCVLTEDGKFEGNWNNGNSSQNEIGRFH